MRKEVKRQLQIVGEKKPAPKAALPDPILPDLNFDAWWLLTQKRLGLQSGLKDALKKHMKSRGYLDQSRFDEGLKDFGI